MPIVWSVVGQRVFTGNGDAGVLWRDTLGDVAIWLMNGTSILSTAVLGGDPALGLHRLPRRRAFLASC